MEAWHKLTRCLAVWVVSLVILVFSVEMTFRAVCKEHFRVRRRWETPSYIALIGLLLLGLWLSAFLMPNAVPEDGMCIGSIMWWTAFYSKIAVVIASGIILTHLISAVLISLQLWRTVKMDPSERIAASRVVYSVGVNALILVG